MALTSALLHLYPRAWRRRYGDEMRQLLAAQRLSVRTIADLVAGAVDARTNPQTTAQQAPSSEGVERIMKSTMCNPAGVSVQDQWRSAGWMVGASILLTAIGVLLKRQIGPNALSEGLLYAAFPAALMLSSECTYFKRYSKAARLTMSVGGALFIVAMMWAAVAIGNAI